MMRKTAALLLFWLLILPSAGFLFVFLIPRAQIHREIRERLQMDIPEGELILLKIPSTVEEGNDPSFIRFHAREFRYQGNMYDVVRQEEHGDTTWYYCLHDEKETELYAGLDEMFQSDSAPQPENRRLVKLLNLPLQWHYLPGQQLPSFRQNDAERRLFSHSFPLKTWLDRPDPPPPKGLISNSNVI